MSVIEVEAVNKRLPHRFPPGLHGAMSESEFRSIVDDTNAVVEPGLKNIASKQCCIACIIICSPCTAFLSCFGLCCAIPNLTRAQKDLRKNTRETLERHNANLRPRGLQVAFKAHQAATMSGGVRQKVYIEVQAAYTLAATGAAQPGYIPPPGSGGFSGPPASGFAGPPAGGYAGPPVSGAAMPPTGVPVPPAGHYQQYPQASMPAGPPLATPPTYSTSVAPAVQVPSPQANYGSVSAGQGTSAPQGSSPAPANLHL